MKYLIVGLGNKGEEYDQTRHNVGFGFLDYLAEKYEMKFESDRFGAYAKHKFRGRNLHFLKPDTYMNLSGHAVSFWMKKLSMHRRSQLAFWVVANEGQRQRWWSQWSQEYTRGIEWF